MWETNGYRQMEMQRDVMAERMQAAAQEAAAKKALKTARAEERVQRALNAHPARQYTWSRFTHPITQFARMLAGLF